MVVLLRGVCVRGLEKKWGVEGGGNGMVIREGKGVR
jgi:hypothetical protein